MAISVTPESLPVASRTPMEASAAIKPPHVSWKALAPIAVALALALLPPPPGLAPHAWYFFAMPA